MNDAYTTWRRQLAYGESVALRHLARRHGVIVVAPTRHRFREYLGWAAPRKAA